MFALVPATEAHALGIVNRLVPAEDLDHVVRDLAATIASNAPLTLRATKEMIRQRIPAGTVSLMSAPAPGVDPVILCIHPAPAPTEVTLEPGKATE